MPCLGCCMWSCTPRYKRLVRGALPRKPQDGLNPDGMEKLYYFSQLYPEKMDQVGEYMHDRAEKQLRRGQTELVALTIEAHIQVISTADTRSRWLLVDSFLRTILMCLASHRPRLQITATYCFIRFVILKDDTMYHLDYHEILLEFVAMCHYTIEDPIEQEEVRHAGIEGLEAILLRCDGLIDNIYSITYMNIVLPCLLFSLNDPEYLHMCPEGRLANSMHSPGIAESCLKAALGRTYSSRLHNVLDPIMKYMDEHKLWWDDLFPVELYRLMIMSIEPGNAYVIIESLVKHASYEDTPDASVRARILETVIEISSCASAESVGPSAFYCVGLLVHELEESVERSDQMQELEERETEEWLQETLIHTLETIAHAMPDYYKVEMMGFLVRRMPFPSAGSADSKLRYILLELVIKVSREYHTLSFDSALPMSLLSPLLRISLSPSPKARFMIHEILHNLLDRHGNVAKLREPTADVESLGLKMEGCTPLDMAFMRRNGLEIYYTLYEGFDCFGNNTQNMKTVYTSAALFIVEAVSEETLVEALRFLINLQDMSEIKSVGWIWREELEAVRESLLQLLLIKVPATAALKKKRDVWQMQPEIVPSSSMLQRAHVMESLRNDGWVGVTERHLCPYSETQVPTWKKVQRGAAELRSRWAAQRVTTVMHVTLPSPFRSLSRALASRFTSGLTVPSVEDRDTRPLPPPVSPRTMEQENRWLFLTEVLMLNVEDSSSEEVDEADEARNLTTGHSAYTQHSAPLSRYELGAVEEESDQEDGVMREDEEDESTVTIEDETSMSSSSARMRESRDVSSGPPSASSHLSASRSDLTRIDSKATPPQKRRDSRPRSSISEPSVTNQVPKTACNKCGKKMIEKEIIVPEVRNIPEESPAPTRSTESNTTEISGPPDLSPKATINQATGAICLCSVTPESSEHGQEPSIETEAGETPETPVSKEPPDDVASDHGSTAVSTSAPITSTGTGKFSTPMGMGTGTPNTPRDTGTSTTPTGTSTTLTGTGTSTTLAEMASDEDLVTWSEFGVTTASSSSRRRTKKISGAEIIGRLKAEAGFTAAHNLLKFTERQARLRMQYRTMPFDQLRPLRQEDEKKGLRETLDELLRNVPPPTAPSTLSSSVVEQWTSERRS